MEVVVVKGRVDSKGVGDMWWKGREREGDSWVVEKFRNTGKGRRRGAPL